MWTTNPSQYELARFCEVDREHYKIISAEIVSEREKRFSTVIQNIITSTDSTVLKTSYAYDYKPRQHIFYRNCWWEIVSVGEINIELNPQALSFVSAEQNKQYILELKKVDL